MERKDYAKQIFNLLKERIQLDELTILDFGCGTGLLTDYMTKDASKIVALDSAEKMIRNKYDIVGLKVESVDVPFHMIELLLHWFS